MIKKVLKHSLTAIPFSAKFPANYVIPLYHSVSDEDLPHLKHVINYKNTIQFEADLDLMSKRFQFVDWNYFKENYNTKQKKPLALLTFDDGLIEFKNIVLPILKRKGIYAINFINPAFINNPEMMFRFKASLILEAFRLKNYKLSPSSLKLLELDRNNPQQIIKKVQSISYVNKEKLDILAIYADVIFEKYQKDHKIYMDFQDLKSVSADGFGIAAHSWDHPYYYELSTSEQLENTQKSINFMKYHGFIEDTFAFPFTDRSVSMAFFDQLFKNNPELKLSFGISGIKQDAFSKNLHRIPMENGFTAKQVLSFESNYFQLKKLFNKNKIARL